MIHLIRQVYRWVFLIFVMFLSLSQPAEGASSPKKEEGPGLSIFEVGISSNSFHPLRGEKVQIRYRLSREAGVTIQIFDGDMELIRTLVKGVVRKAGGHQEPWDGKDLDGKVVPNEAYFFTIEAEDPAQGETAVYDPVTFSGGESFDLSDAKFDREGGTMTYRLSQPSRVLVRIGITGSALLKTLVDWEPRIEGEITEYWNGKDEDNVIDVWSQSNFRTLISYFTLPENSIITYGNAKTTYQAYKANLKPGARPKKQARPMVNRRKISPHFLTSRLEDRAFKAVIMFPEFKETIPAFIPAAKDKIHVRVDIEEKERPLLLNQQFEIIFFMDGVYFAEEEKGYVPFNFPIELKPLSEGEHVLTVNIVTFNERFGVGSRKVKVVK